MDKYMFLQNYWWFIISLLAGLLVFLLVAGRGQRASSSQLKNKLNQRMLVNPPACGIYFLTTPVTFGGAFASFPLFYSTSFNGAYWV